MQLAPNTLARPLVAASGMVENTNFSVGCPRECLGLPKRAFYLISSYFLPVIRLLHQNQTALVKQGSPPRTTAPELLDHKWARQVYGFFSRRIVYHSLFWLAFLVVLVSLEGTENGLGFALTNELIVLVFYAAMVYFNLYYLVPNYLSKERFGTYVFLLVLATIIITPLKMIILHFKWAAYPAMQQELIRPETQYSQFMAMFFLGGGSSLVKIISDWVRHQRERQILETQTMQSELRFLKSQINPHFLFNTLNNLYALTLKKSDEAPEIVIKLSEMMRYMLYECNEKRVPLRKEVNYLRNYLDLERLRQGNNISISFDVEGRVEHQQIAPLMFIPFLENSFKHGLSNQITQGYVHILLQVEDQHVHFYIENSKPDTPPSPDKRRSGGIGLVNVRRRLDLLYPGQYELTIADKPKSYAVNLEIDLEFKI